MQKVTLKDAVILTGRNYTTIFRAVKSKKLTEYKEDGKSYVFVNELFALFPNKTGLIDQKTELAVENKIAQTEYVTQQDKVITTLQDQVKHLETEKKHLLSMIEELKNAKQLLKSECDDLKDQREQVMKWVQTLQTDAKRLVDIQTENAELKTGLHQIKQEFERFQNLYVSPQSYPSLWKRLTSHFKTAS